MESLNKFGWNDILRRLKGLEIKKTMLRTWDAQELLGINNLRDDNLKPQNALHGGVNVARIPVVLIERNLNEKRE